MDFNIDFNIARSTPYASLVSSSMIYLSCGLFELKHKFRLSLLEPRSKISRILINYF